MERDPVRGGDSLETFKEILAIAKEKEVSATIPLLPPELHGHHHFVYFSHKILSGIGYALDSVLSYFDRKAEKVSLVPRKETG